MKIAVVGLGYVGLPLSIQFARSCVSVLELDADPKKVELLNNGQSYIKHIQSAEIAELVAAGKFYASTDFGQIKEVEAVIICVPTPLNKNRKPDLSYVLRPAGQLPHTSSKGRWWYSSPRLIPERPRRTCASLSKKTPVLSQNPLLPIRQSARCAPASTLIWLSRRNVRIPGINRLR